MNLLGPIKSIMTKDLITVNVDDSIARVRDIFAEHSIHHLPVVNDGELIGIVSKSDIGCLKTKNSDSELAKKLEEIKLHQYSVREVMTTGIATLSPDDKINVALEVFLANLFHAIPVLEDGKLVGIVTTLDVIRRVAHDMEIRVSYDK